MCTGNRVHVFSSQLHEQQLNYLVHFQGRGQGDTNLDSVFLEPSPTIWGLRVQSQLNQWSIAAYIGTVPDLPSSTNVAC